MCHRACAVPVVRSNVADPGLLSVLDVRDGVTEEVTLSSFQGRVERQRPAAPQRIKVGPSAHCTFTCLMCSPAASPGGNSGISVAHGSCVARASPTESHFKLFIGFVIRLFRKISRHTELLAHGLCVARKVSKSISNRRAIFNSLLDLSFGFSKRCLSIPSYLPQHCPNKLHFSL